jgi:Uma2 family endonuclease
MAIPQRHKLYTVREFEDFIARPENADRRFELINGELVEKVPTQIHAWIAHLISDFFFVYLRQHPNGWALVEARYQLPGDEHNARIPDVSFVLKLEGRALTSSGPAPYMPELAVEIKSPDDTYHELRERAHYYLANGTRIVWLVYPEKRAVEVLTLDDFDLLREDATLEGGDLLPEFALPVKDIFAD